MKYYLFDRTLDLKIIGNYPQIQTFIKGYDSDRLESCSKIARYYCSKIPDKPLDFDGLELAKKAKLTDYTHAGYLSSYCGLLVSQRLYDFFGQLRMVDFLPYEVKIYEKKATAPLAKYRWIHYIRDYPEMIDYAKSHFYEDHPKPDYEKLPIRSLSEYESMQDKVQYAIDSRHIVLKKAVVSRFDVLRIGVVKSETYITEEVKKQMEDIGFTGIDYKPADYLVVE